MYKFERKIIKKGKKMRKKKEKEGKTHFQFRLCAYVLFELSFFFNMAKVDWRGESMRGLENFPFQITFFLF